MLRHPLIYVPPLMVSIRRMHHNYSSDQFIIWFLFLIQIGVKYDYASLFPYIIQHMVIIRTLVDMEWR